MGDDCGVGIVRVRIAVFYICKLWHWTMSPNSTWRFSAAKGTEPIYQMPARSPIWKFDNVRMNLFLVVDPIA